MANEEDRRVVLKKFSSMTWKRNATDDSIGRPKNDGNIRQYDRSEKVVNENDQGNANGDSSPRLDLHFTHSTSTNLNERFSPFKEVPVETRKTEVSNTNNCKTEFNEKIPMPKCGNFFRKIKPGSSEYEEFYINERFLPTAMKILLVASKGSAENEEADENFVHVHSNPPLSEKIADSFSEVATMKSESSIDASGYEKCDVNPSRYESGAGVVHNWNSNLTLPISSSTNAHMAKDLDSTECNDYQNVCNSGYNAHLPGNLESMRISDSAVSGSLRQQLALRQENTIDSDTQMHHLQIKHILTPEPPVNNNLDQRLSRIRKGAEESSTKNSGTLNTNAPPFIPSMYRNVAPDNVNVPADMANVSADVSVVQAGTKETKVRLRTGYVLNRKPQKPVVDVENRIDVPKSQIKDDLKKTLNALDAQRLNSMRCSVLISETPSVPVVSELKVNDLSNNPAIASPPLSLTNETIMPQYVPLIPVSESCTNKFGNNCETAKHVLNDDQSLVHSRMMTANQSMVPSSMANMNQPLASFCMVTADQSVVPCSMVTMNQSLAPFCMVTPDQSVMPSTMTTPNQSLVPSGIPNMNPSLVLSSMTTANRSLVSSSMPNMNQSLVPSSMATANQSLVTSSMPNMNPSLVLCSMATANQSLVTSSIPNMNQSLVPSSMATANQPMVPACMTTANQSSAPSCIVTSKSNESYASMAVPLWNFDIPTQPQVFPNPAPFEIPPSPMFQNQVHVTRNQNKSDSITINIEDDGLLNFAEPIPVKPILKHNQAMDENVISFSYDDHIEDQTMRNASKKVSFTV